MVCWVSENWSRTNRSINDVFPTLPTYRVSNNEPDKNRTFSQKDNLECCQRILWSRQINQHFNINATPRPCFAFNPEVNQVIF